MRTKIFCFALIAGLIPCVVPAVAQTPNSIYMTQQDDWLSRIAQKAYGNAHLYYRIVEGTNKKAVTDPSFTTIANPNRLPAGQKIWIPALPTSDNLTHIPKTNCEIRLWYNYQIVAIGALNEKWETDGLSLKARALKAYNSRHEARVHARFLMQNKEEVKALQQRDQVKYGNPDGPTFDYLIQKSTSKGLSLEAAYQGLIESSSRTDKGYNADCQ